MGRAFTFDRLGQLGRLGNQMWQTAATINLAFREDADVALPGNWEYRRYLRVPDEFYGPAAPLSERVDVERLDGGPYYQALQHIDLVAPMLPKWFAPSGYGMNRLGEIHGRLLWLTDARHCTAVHVRRTDYLQHADRFPQPSAAYRQAAAKLVPADTLFLVFSDDPDWCEQNLDQIGLAGQPVEIVRGFVRDLNPAARPQYPDDILDLWLMARCQSHIIANSSYSWWGAYLSDQEQVFYPDVWFGDPALHATMWDAMPSHWVQIHADPAE